MKIFLSPHPTPYPLHPIFKTDTHEREFTTTDENLSSPIPYSLFPIFRINARNTEPLKPLVQEGRRKEAEGRREECLYSKFFHLFGLMGYFRRAALVQEGFYIGGSKAPRKKACTGSFLTFLNWWIISAALH